MSWFYFSGKFFSQFLLGGYLRLDKANSNEVEKNKKQTERIDANGRSNGISDNNDRHTPVRRWLNDNVECRR